MSSGNSTVSSSSGGGGATGLGASYQLVVGPLLIGVVVNALVFGVCVMQLLSYVMSGYKDGWRVLTLIGWIYVIDTFQVCSSVSMLWHYVVDNFTNPIALAYSPWEYATLPIFSSLASVPIQHFMAYRIMRFSGSKLLFAFISLLSWAQAALAVTSAIQGVIHTSIESHRKIIPYADAWLALSACCDASITALLLWYLLKSRTGFERTDSIISTICTTTVKAAVPVTVLCILDLCFLTTTPNNNLHYMFALPVGRLLTNTLMSTLNERKHLRSQMENSTPNRGGINLSALTTSKHRFQVHPAQVRINIEHDTDAGGDIPVGSPPYPYPGARRASAVGGQSPISPVPSYYSPQSPTARESINGINGINGMTRNSRGWRRDSRIGNGNGNGNGNYVIGEDVDEDKYDKYKSDTKYVVRGIGGIATIDESEKSLGDDTDGDADDAKASPITESPTSASEQRVVTIANLPRIPVPVPVVVRRGDDGRTNIEDGVREVREVREERRGEEEEVGGVRYETVGVGYGY